MILGLVYCVIYYIIVKIIELYYVSKIEQGVSAYIAINYRRIVRRIRIVIFLFCLVGAAVIQYFINSDLEIGQMVNAFWPVTFMYVIMMRMNKNSPYGNFSYQSIDNVMNSNKNFIVFLRGFEKDNYTAKKKLLKKKKFNDFSEFHFFECLRKLLDYEFYAVGMTKEIEAPFGADRVYLENYCWRKDVKMMMDKSAYIIVEINDKPSCVWEIEQCDIYPKKTFFLITDKEKYKNVYNYIIQKRPFIGKGFPHPNSINSLVCFTFPSYGNKLEIKFENNIYSYKELAKTMMLIIKQRAAK